jgi:dihydroorotate dehydrogenase
VKVSPDEASYDAVVETAVKHRFAGIVAVNTTKARPEGTAYPADGGLSGRPLRRRSTEVIKTLFRAAKGRLALIGVGGVFSAEDAYEKLQAGASLVEVYTGFVYQGPGTAGSLARGLLRLMERDGVRTLQEVIGRSA